jgi:hypothetical protein
MTGREPVLAVEGALHIRVLGIVLAGGKGTRLFPLTRERAKPAVPFGGEYRIVDFVLSNFINSGINSVYVLTQFRSQSLLQHLSEGWQFGGLLKSHFVIPVPVQMRSEDESWYQGTADSILQNIHLVEQSDAGGTAVRMPACQAGRLSILLYFVPLQADCSSKLTNLEIPERAFLPIFAKTLGHQSSQPASPQSANGDSQKK